MTDEKIEYSQEHLQTHIQAAGIIVHWLSDVDKLTVLCDNFKPGDKYTLEESRLTCQKCIERKQTNGRTNSKISRD